MRKEKVSVKMEGLDCVIGKQTKKHNTITMRMSEESIVPAVKLFKQEREGDVPETGLIGYELYALYQDEEPGEKQPDLFDEGEPVTGDELIDGMRLSTVGTCNTDPILTTAVKDQDKANEAFAEMDEALGIALED